MKHSAIDADRAEENGDLETALLLWKELAESEQSPAFFRRYGRIAQKLERWHESEKALSVSLELDPGSSLTLEIMGSLWATRTDKVESHALEAARDWFHRAVKIEAHARLLTELGSVYIALGNEMAASEAFEEALRLDSSYEEALYNLALLRESTRPKEAIGLLDRALEEDAAYGPAHQALGRIYQRENDLVRAEYHFRRCLELDPEDYWSMVYLANLLSVQGADSEAAKKYEEALALQPSVKAVRDLYANFLDSIGSHEKATGVRSAFQ